MPVLNRIAALADDMTAWRRHLHQHPELAFDCYQTAAFVVARLREFGVDEIHEGIGRTGVVAIIRGQGPDNGTRLGLRADMDALPIAEETGLDYASTVPGRMHACGHDGHTTMLLGAARYLAETRNFAGSVALIFQPAEEDGGGAREMVREGMMDRFGITQVFALHNSPDMATGSFVSRPGALMAAVDDFRITLRGRGGHAAMPQQTADPVAAAVALAGAIQTIVSRNHDPIEDLVLSLTCIHAGTASNIVPETATLGGTCRSFSPETRDMVLRRLRQLCEGHALAFDLAVDLDFIEGYPATVNDAAALDLAAAAAREVAGPDGVDVNAYKEMGAEDFSFMLEERPGAYLFLGQGAGPGLHNAGYDFNDAIAPVGASFFARLVERAQPLT